MVVSDGGVVIFRGGLPGELVNFIDFGKEHS